MGYRGLQPDVLGPSASQMATFARVLLSGYCCCVWVFVRRGFGFDALFPSGPAAIAIIIGYAGFGECPELLAVFLPLWLLVVICHRVQTLRRRRSGQIVHSRHLGDPWLARKLWPFGRLSDAAAKMVFEPLISLAVGGLIYAAGNEPLGRFFLFAAAGLFVMAAMHEAAMDARLRAWSDKDIEMRNMASRIRNRR